MDPQQKSSPRDVFVYLFATGALYFSAFSIIQLLIAYVNVLFPDPLNSYYQPQEPIRWGIAILVVIFPAYLWAMRFIRKDIAADPSRADIRVRKWLLYLTIFLSAILLIGTLITLISFFLNGDITTAFILKVIGVLAVGGAIFWYYLTDLRTKGAPLPGGTRNIVYGLLVLVLAIVVTGFVLAGSPFRQRQVRFDAQKVNDLQNIQYNLVNYWQTKETLPDSLAGLRDEISGYVPPLDPQSRQSYEYRKTGDKSFELCAEFNLPTGDRAGYQKPMSPDQNDIWDHSSGRECFDRTIDPQKYPPYKNLQKPIMPSPVR